MAKRIISEEMNNLKKAFENKLNELGISLKQACADADITPSIFRKIPQEGILEKNANKMKKWLEKQMASNELENAKVITKVAKTVTLTDLARMENEIDDARGRLAEMQNDFEYMQAVFHAQMAKEHETKQRKERIKNLTKEQEDAILAIYEGRYVNKNLAILLDCTPATISNAKNRAKERGIPLDD